MCVWAQACVSMGVPVSECMGTRPGSPLCAGVWVCVALLSQPGLLLPQEKVRVYVCV